MDSIHIEEIIERDINSLGCHIWGIEFSGRMSHQTLRVFIDKEDGVSIEDCEKVSNHISNVLDAENSFSDDYMLEVSSPGLERKFFKIDQYIGYINNFLKVKFLTKDNKYKTIIGTLKNVGNSFIVLNKDGEDIEIDFTSIKKSILQTTGI